MGPNLVLEAVLGGSGGHLGPKSQQEHQKCARPPVLPPLGGPTWRPKSTKNRWKIDPKLDQNFDCSFDNFFIDFGAILASKIDQILSKNRSKNQSKSCLIFWWIFDICLSVFSKIFDPIWKLESAKSVIRITLLALFSFLHQVAVDALLDGILVPTWTHFGIQNRLKFDEKSIKKSIKILIYFLDRFFCDFW